MISTQAPAPRRRSHGRAAGLLVLLVQAAIAVLPLVHEVAETREATRSLASGVNPACPPDCSQPGHHHQYHDRATCTACRSFRAPAETVRLALPEPLRLLRGVRSAELEVVRPRRLIGPASLRAPPSPVTTLS